MTVKTIGHKKYEVEDSYYGHTWRFTLKGGWFSNERKAQEAADRLIEIALRCLVAAKMINTVFEKSTDDSGQDYTDKERRLVEEWKAHAMSLEELSMAVPDTVNGFKTGSFSITFERLGHVSAVANEIINKLTGAAPMHMNDGMDAFREEWADTVIRINPNDIKWHIFNLATLYKRRYNRDSNTPTLIARSPDCQNHVLEAAMKRATAHLTVLLPHEAPPSRAVQTTPAAPAIEGPVVRGNRPQTTLNVMLPTIEEKLAAITDPAARALIEERIAAIKKRVEIATAKTHVDPAVIDLMMIVDTLEETINAGLGDDHPDTDEQTLSPA